MYCWTHIKTLEFTVATLNLLFPNENVYMFLFTPTGATYPHRLIVLNYIPHRTSVEQYKSCKFHCAHSCTVLPIHTTFPHISVSQHCAVKYPESTCGSRLSPRYNWDNSDLGSWLPVIIKCSYYVSWYLLYPIIRRTILLRVKIERNYIFILSLLEIE